MGAKFTSIELELPADFDLVELSKALEDDVGTNYCGKSPDGKPPAYFYAGSYRGPFDDCEKGANTEASTERIDSSASSLCDLIERIEPKFRNLWDRANDKVFDVGLDANIDRRVIIDFLSAGTMNRMAALGVRLAVSVYAIDLENEINGLKSRAR